MYTIASRKSNWVNGARPVNNAREYNHDDRLCNAYFMKVLSFRPLKTVIKTFISKVLAPSVVIMKQFVLLLSVVLLQAWLCPVHARQLSGVEEAGVYIEWFWMDWNSSLHHLVLYRYAGEDRLFVGIRKPDVVNTTDSSVSLCTFQFQSSSYYK